jgi:subfamily B ATP-binding cassette protein MsbA
MLVPMLDIMFNKSTAQDLVALPEFTFSKEYLNTVSAYYFQKLGSFGKYGPLIIVCIIVIISNVISNVFKYLAGRILHTARFLVIQIIKDQLYQKLISSEVSYFSDERKGDLLSKFTFDMINIEYLITDSLKGFIRDPFTLIMYLGFLLFISWKLTLMALIILPFGGVLIYFISSKLKKAAKGIDITNGELLSITEETFSGLRVIKSFTAEKFVSNKFSTVNKTNAHARYHHDTNLELSSSLSEIFGVMMVVVILFIGGRFVLDGIGDLKAAEFVAYLGLFSQVITPAKSLVQCFSVIQKGIVASENIFKILDRDEAIFDKEDSIDVHSLTYGIEVRNLSFKYKDKFVLKDINIFIPKGKTIALVGPSGSGKSTLADLISRFYDIHEGEVLFDGINIKNIKQRSLREKIGIVAQESVLFNDTIKNNIAFGNENKSDEEIIQAAKLANAHEFIMLQPDKYETVIGDRGNKLSGGQKQRLSIARALLKNPEVLILDEATSSLDAESEKLVQEALNTLMHTRTSLVIAHRLSTIRNADLIMVINDGKIIEQGNHHDLLTKDGFYKKLISLQSEE